MNLKTKVKSSWMQKYPLHVVLFALYPILALLAFNISEINVSAGFRALLISLSAALLLMVVFRFIYRDWRRVALVSDPPVNSVLYLWSSIYRAQGNYLGWSVSFSSPHIDPTMGRDRICFAVVGIT